jgi:hypothetical protein
MHRKGFVPGSILNIGVSSCPELAIWKWIYPNVPLIGVDPKPKRAGMDIPYIQAAATDGSGGEAVFCFQCKSLTCKASRRHRKKHRLVSAVAIDEVSRAMPPPYFIWMDIDGSELEALPGAIRTLTQTGWICIERVDWTRRHRGRIHRFLRRQGFRHRVHFGDDDLYQRKIPLGQQA